MNPEVKMWAVCDAPAGGCGGGRRKRVLVELPFNSLHPSCVTCGSQMRICRDQKKEKK